MFDLFHSMGSIFKFTLKAVFVVLNGFICLIYVLSIDVRSCRLSGINFKRVLIVIV